MPDFAEGYLLTNPGMQWFTAHYMGEAPDFLHPYASPLHVESLAGLPPAMVFTCGLDPAPRPGPGLCRQADRRRRRRVVPRGGRPDPRLHEPARGDPQHAGRPPRLPRRAAAARRRSARPRRWPRPRSDRPPQGRGPALSAGRRHHAAQRREQGVHRPAARFEARGVADAAGRDRRRRGAARDRLPRAGRGNRHHPGRDHRRIAGLADLRPARRPGRHGMARALSAVSGRNGSRCASSAPTATSTSPPPTPSSAPGAGRASTSWTA